MTTTVSRMAAIGAFFVAQVTFACAAEIKVYATIGVKHSLEDLTAKFEKTSGHKVTITWGTGAALAKRIQAGEQADLLVLTRQGLDTLSKDGKVAAGSERNFASSMLAVAIKKGAPKPDISTPEAFKATMLNAKSVAYPDPAGGGLSGVYFAQLAEKMGFAEQLKSKAKFPADNFAGKLVASGEAEFAIQQKPELISVEGVEILGSLPAAINVTTVFSAGISKDAKESGASMELLKYLESPESAAVFKRDGLDPPPGRPQGVLKRLSTTKRGNHRHGRMCCEDIPLAGDTPLDFLLNLMGSDVHLHPCSGLPAAFRAGATTNFWADQLVKWGYAVLVVDSFGTRGIEHTTQATQ